MKGIEPDSLKGQVEARRGEPGEGKQVRGARWVCSFPSPPLPSPHFPLYSLHPPHFPFLLPSLCPFHPITFPLLSHHLTSLPLPSPLFPFFSHHLVTSSFPLPIILSPASLPITLHKIPFTFPSFCPFLPITFPSLHFIFP